MDNLDVVIKRIRKLLALASRNSSVAEAASAAAEAQRLMTKYQLEMASVEAHEGTVAGAVIQEAIEESHGKLVRWRSTLAMAVAEANQCRSIWLTDGKGHKGALTFFGTQANVQMAKALFESVAEQIERLTKEALAKAKIVELGEIKIYGGSFRLGAVSAVRGRLVELTEERDRRLKAQAALPAGPAVTALAVFDRNQSAIENYLGKAFDSPVRNVAPSRQRITPDGFADGKVAGSSIHLGKQLA